MKSSNDPDHGNVGTRDQNLGNPVALVGTAEALALAMVVVALVAAGSDATDVESTAADAGADPGADPLEAVKARPEWAEPRRPTAEAGGDSAGGASGKAVVLPGEAIAGRRCPTPRAESGSAALFVEPGFGPGPMALPVLDDVLDRAVVPDRGE
jgi:hypothetical protein